MKRKLKELDVDFIGGQGPLTMEEEKTISEYLKNQNILKNKRQLSRTKTSHQRKNVV